MGIFSGLSRGFKKTDTALTRQGAAISAAKQEALGNVKAGLKKRYNMARTVFVRKGQIDPENKGILTSGGYMSPELFRNGTPFFYKPGKKNNTGNEVTKYYEVGGSEDVTFTSIGFFSRRKFSMTVKAKELPSRPSYVKSFNEHDYYEALKNPIPIDLLVKKLRSRPAYNNVNSGKLENAVKHLTNPEHAFNYTGDSFNLLANKNNLNSKTYNNFDQKNAKPHFITDTQSGVKIPILMYSQNAKKTGKNLTVRDKKRREIARALSSNNNLNNATLKHYFSDLAPETLREIRTLLKGSELMKKLLAVAKKVETIEEQQEAAVAAQEVASTTNSAAKKIVEATEAPEELRTAAVAEAAKNVVAASQVTAQVVENPGSEQAVAIPNKNAQLAEILKNYGLTVENLEKMKKSKSE